MMEKFVVESKVFLEDGRRLRTAKIEKIVRKGEYICINTESKSLRFSIHNFRKGGLEHINFLKKGDIIIYARDYEKHFVGI